MRSILINATPEKIWPWLVQLGSGRAGWYSYDRIDNGGKLSATQILPELQNLAVGDIIPAVPGSKDAFIVQQINHLKSIVLIVPVKTAIDEPDPFTRMLGKLRMSWLLSLEPVNERQTRLISRGRISDNWLSPSAVPSSKKPIFIERIYSLLARMPWFVLLPVAIIGHSIMESRMLRGIKKRVEKV